jgi:hypothetical protein
MFQWRSIFLRTLSSPLSCLQARNERESEGVVCAVTEIAEGGNELKRSAQQALGPEGDLGALCLMSVADTYPEKSGGYASIYSGPPPRELNSSRDGG